MNASRPWQTHRDLKDATFEAQLVPRVQHARSELDIVVGETVELDLQSPIAFDKLADDQCRGEVLDLPVLTASGSYHSKFCVAPYQMSGAYQ